MKEKPRNPLRRLLHPAGKRPARRLDTRRRLKPLKSQRAGERLLLRGLQRLHLLHLRLVKRAHLGLRKLLPEPQRENRLRTPRQKPDRSPVLSQPHRALENARTICPERFYLVAGAQGCDREPSSPSWGAICRMDRMTLSTCVHNSTPNSAAPSAISSRLAPAAKALSFHFFLTD